ncbi:hypothetical protein N9Y08_06100 [Paracoccaceae bacterium]|jgi:hypothetical protein|nr:hypothetical protein [Paracoccaceae bacterium]
MKHLVGKVISKKVSFMGDEVEIRKLSVAEVFKVQAMVKTSTKSKSEDAQISLLRDVIRLAVVGADELTDEDFNSFPIAELNDVSNHILNYSGLGEAQASGN